MKKPLLIALPGNEAIAERLAQDFAVEFGALAVRRFPDGETYLRYESDPNGRHVVLVCTLDRPNEKFLPVVFAAATARDLGATQVGLIAPYLAYMRQDRRFCSGEAVTSTYFAGALCQWIDWLVTVDPHLHRHSDLSEIYSIPYTVLHAGPFMAAWIRREINDPLLIGPDAESRQWVSDVADRASVPYVVLRKDRCGDRDVEVSIPDLGRWRNRTPVLIDDIISSAGTMIEVIHNLNEAGMRPPICLAVHGIFAADSYDRLVAAGASQIVTTNTVAHKSNMIDISKLVGKAVLNQISRQETIAG